MNKHINRTYPHLSGPSGVNDANKMLDIKPIKESDMNWIRFSDLLPAEGKVVMTKIDDKNGIRNEQKLVRKGNLMWFPDMSMYVYYTPTHWREI